jgi:hypothetical protein
LYTKSKNTSRIVILEISNGKNVFFAILDSATILNFYDCLHVFIFSNLIIFKKMLKYCIIYLKRTNYFIAMTSLELHLEYFAFIVSLPCCRMVGKLPSSPSFVLFPHLIVSYLSYLLFSDLKRCNMPVLRWWSHWLWDWHNCSFDSGWYPEKWLSRKCFGKENHSTVSFTIVHII